MGWPSPSTCLSAGGTPSRVGGGHGVAVIARQLSSEFLESEDEGGPPNSSGPKPCPPTRPHGNPNPPRADGVAPLPKDV